MSTSTTIRTENNMSFVQYTPAVQYAIENQVPMSEKDAKVAVKFEECASNKTPYGDLKFDSGDIEILLPLENKHATKINAAQYAKFIKHEFAVKYLESIGVTPSPSNIGAVLKQFPINKCKITQVMRSGVMGLNVERPYLSIKPHIKTDKTWSDVSRKQQFRADDYMHPFDMEEQTEGMSFIDDDEQASKDDFDDQLSVSGKYTNIRTGQVPTFEEYSKRFVYPYNVARQLDPTNVQEPVDKKATIYDMAHITEDDIEEQISDDSMSQGSRMISESEMGIHKVLSQQQPNSPLLRKVFSSASKRTASRSHSRSTKGSQSPNSRAYSRMSSRYLSKTNPHLPEEDTFSMSETSTLHERYPNVFKTPHPTVSEVDQLFDVELSKPPYLSQSEVYQVQENFVKKFPFHLWSNQVHPKELEKIKQSVYQFKHAIFVSDFADLLYWTFLKEFADHSKYKYNREHKFIEIYGEILDMINSHRKHKFLQTVQLPIILLCVRVVTESIFQTCYPQWWASKYGELFADRMHMLITFLFDPNDYLSHLAPIESNVKERRMASHIHKFRQKLNIKVSKNRTYTISPMVRYIMEGANSMGARNMLSKDLATEPPEVLQLKELMSLFSQELRTKIFGMMIKKKLMPI